MLRKNINLNGYILPIILTILGFSCRAPVNRHSIDSCKNGKCSEDQDPENEGEAGKGKPGEGEGGDSGEGGGTRTDPGMGNPDKPSGEVTKGFVAEGRLWRLTNDQYSQHVDSLIGRSTGLSTMFDPTPVNDDRFGHEPDLQPIDTSLATFLEFNINKVVKAGSQNLTKQLSCELSALNQDCLFKFLDVFGTKSFRRPITAQEKQNYWKLYESVQKKAGASDAFHSVVEVILRSPHTLFRSEVGEVKEGVRVLSAAELAVALSYALTNSPPDAGLEAKVKDGSLSDPAVYLAEAKRLMASDGYLNGFSDYVLRWSKAYWIESIGKNEEMFPEYTDKLKTAMKAEVVAFAHNLVKKNKMSFESFYTSSASTITPPLADFYSAGAFMGSKDVVAREGERGGVVTLPGVVAAMSSDYTAPMHRASFLMSGVACETPPPPPPVIEPVKPADGTKSFRERFAEHTTDKTCASCHTIMDAYAFSLENWDPIGRYRTMEDKLPVSSKGILKRSKVEDIPFDSIVDLMAGLAKDEAAQRCFIKNAFTYINGRAPRDQDKALMDSLFQKFKGAELDMSQVFLGLVTAESFKVRSVGGGS